MEEPNLELLKHRLRIREILLDKLVLAVLLGVLAYGGTIILKAYENRLQGQLDQLKEVYNFERILAQSDITAHEKVWLAIADLRFAVNNYKGKPVTDTIVIEIQTIANNVAHVGDQNDIYLTSESRIALNELTKPKLESFIQKWEGDGAEGMSEQTWQFLASATDAVRNRIRADIEAKRKLVDSRGAS
jgi:alpha-N-acetylglucosamine transferase